MGGLSCAAYLAKHGLEIEIVEASPGAGGLAAPFEAGGLRFDGGPYILLDRPGLAWAFAQLGLDVSRDLELVRVEDVYEVRAAGSPAVRIRADLDETADGLERAFPGSAKAYRAFVAEMRAAHGRLAPMLTSDAPGAWTLLSTGAFRALGTLLRPLGSLLRRTGLPEPVQHALGIWTHVAGQKLDEAPAPLAFVPALIHTHGCYVPRGGVGAVSERAFEAARAAGVRFRFETEVERVQVERGRAVGVRLTTGEDLRADAVVSNASGVGTLLELAAGESGLDDAVRKLPLQSPGVAAFLVLRRKAEPPYLRFWRKPEDAEAPTRLLVQPSVVSPAHDGGRVPARLVAPLAHTISEGLRGDGQDALLERALSELATDEDLGPFEVVARRTPVLYGARHHLYRDSMNPVMTAAFMRAGRLPHRLAKPVGLYLVGSSTHPGQWVSFCAISGILGARKLLADLAISPMPLVEA